MDVSLTCPVGGEVLVESLSAPTGSIAREVSELIMAHQLGVELARVPDARFSMLR